jgi:3-hydroxyacyl-[acyl-carrier-protein] dehydratase|tara:strand:+ start:7871 stop:8263 length:393 start_codon:yes stop_codon:yes gene_type:complete
MSDITKLINYTNRVKNDTKSIYASFILNKDHEIFKGHFPQHPIVPGVMEMKLIEDIIFDTLSIKGGLKSASNIKFLTPMFPEDNFEFQCEVLYSFKEDSILECSSKIRRGNINYAIMNCSYEIFNSYYSN